MQRNLYSGERQVGETLDKIRPDHIARYEYAAVQIKKMKRKRNFGIIDCACGCGYGSYILSSRIENTWVLGIDISEESIAFARKHYTTLNEKGNRPRGGFMAYDIMDQEKTADNSCEVIVSLETVEHIQDDVTLLSTFKRILKPGGALILSTPNANNYPLGNHPFHVRHYRPEDIEKKLAAAGFRITAVVSQENNTSTILYDGWDGMFNTITCILE